MTNETKDNKEIVIEIPQIKPQSNKSNGLYLIHFFIHVRCSSNFEMNLNESQKMQSHNINGLRKIMMFFVLKMKNYYKIDVIF